ncbi:hypothetical protein, partial [Pseudomonas aeruginosa]|uniref:hypothetical protein n=1 Tax=Pseudomonas aeruginosa TaxID=287 RepID=UPI0031B6C65F
FYGTVGLAYQYGYGFLAIYLGVYRNRLLLGVVVTQGEGMRQIDPPPGTSVVSGSSPSGAPQGLYGLVEVTIAPDIRDPEGDHSQTVTIDVIENR